MTRNEMSPLVALVAFVSTIASKVMSRPSVLSSRTPDSVDGVGTALVP
jgi:hypothetical protein